MAACRSRCSRAVRRSLRAFFSPALEGDDHGERIAEDTSDVGPGDEAGEAVDVQESLELGHRRIVTSFPRRGKPDFVGKHREKSAAGMGTHPPDFTKSRKKKRTLGVSEPPTDPRGTQLLSLSHLDRKNWGDHPSATDSCLKS